MKRRIVILLLLIFSCLAARGQEITPEDSTLLKSYGTINDYSMIGIHYGAALSRGYFNPSRIQESVFIPVNFGVTYTRYGKMFGYMPYFGFQLGLLYTQEGYQFKENSAGVKDYICYAYKATMEAIEVPFMAHGHFDFWKMKIMADIGLYGGYRLSIHREYEDHIPEKYREYENTFHPLENRFDYGIKGGAGIGLVFDPIEIHIMCFYKHSLNELHQPDINNRTMERDDNSRYYYKWSYTTNTVLTVGIHYQLTRRTGRTRAMLRKEARDNAIMIMSGNEKDNSESR